MKFYHLIRNSVLTVLYFMVSQTLGNENDITQAMMKIADSLIDTSEKVYEEFYPDYYGNITSKLEKLNDIAFGDIYSNDLKKVREYLERNFSNMYKLSDEKDVNVIPILPEVLANRMYHILRSRIDRTEIASLVISRLKNITKTRRGATDSKSKFEERFSEQLLNELNDDFVADANEEFENPKQFWTQPKTNGTRRLYRASVTSIRDYPFMVSIFVAQRFWCGGVLFWNDIVVTAASCLQLLHNNRFYRENPRALSVRIGSNVSSAGGEMVEAMEIYFYPGYKPKTLNHNIAIIRLRYLVFFNSPIPKIIRLSTANNPPSISTEVLVLAWGAYKLSGFLQGPGELRYQHLPIYPNILCADLYGKDSFEYRTMFCAGTLDFGTGACNHDVGGAAIYQGRLLGLVSHGSTQCGAENNPTVFTNIGYYQKWIKKINSSMPHYYRSTVATTTTLNTTTETTTTKNVTIDDAPITEEIAAP